MDLSSKKVAILVHNYFEQAEFEEPFKALKDAGAMVHVITANDASDLQAMEQDVNKGDTFTADMKLDEADVDEYDAVVLPGGTVNADHIRVNTAAQSFVTTVLQAGKPVAAICHAPWLLVSSRLVQDRHLTSFPSLQDDITNAGGDWTDEEVVIDDNLITSRNPDDLPAFCSALISSLQ